MRFEDMVIKDWKSGVGPLHAVGLVEGASVQHEADMGYEVACPCACHNWEDAGCEAAPCLCSGTGRMTLGRIVEWSRGLGEGR